MVAAALAVPALVACRAPKPTALPVGLSPATAARAGEQATLVWVGRGQAERFENGAWRRAPAFDYEFSVEQHRYADHWESVKTMRRAHPEYDGSAGPRVQTYLFRLDLEAPSPGGEVTYRIASSLGKGAGHGDREFRRAVLELEAEVSVFAPFDRYRISQHYRYEDGKLDELVELLDGSSPWVRNREEATLFSAATFAAPPTTLGQLTPASGAPLRLAPPVLASVLSSGAGAAFAIEPARWVLAPAAWGSARDARAWARAEVKRRAHRALARARAAGGRVLDRVALHLGGR